MSVDRDRLKKLRPDAPLREPDQLEPARTNLHRVMSGVTTPPTRSRWALPAAALLTAAAVVVIAVAMGTASTHRDPALGSPGQSITFSGDTPTQAGLPTTTVQVQPTAAAAAGILNDAAAALAAAAPYPTPDPNAFFYRKSTEVETWTSISGTQGGTGTTRSGKPVAVPGCRNNEYVGRGTVGPCRLISVAHFRADAPTQPAAWGPYLDLIDPGMNLQGKATVAVLHQDLLQPQATAALLRYTQTCPGLRTIPVAAQAGAQFIGVTCTSMAKGSYALVFQASTHAWVGFQTVNAGTAAPIGPAEIVQTTAIVAHVGERP